jgi:hypothetical protein
LDLNEPDLFGQSPSVKLTDTAGPSSGNTGRQSQSMTMSEPSTQTESEESISSSEDFPASPGPLPGSEEARKMTVTSGRKCSELLKLYNLSGSLAKMSEILLTSQWASSAAFLTWKASGTKPSHLLFQLAASMPRTEETGSGSAPEMWPTPTASDHKGSGPTVIRKDGKNRLNDRLDYATEQRAQGGGSLNPEFVEWLMGYEIGYTVCDHWETRSSRRSSRK